MSFISVAKAVDFVDLLVASGNMYGQNYAIGQKSQRCGWACWSLKHWSLSC